MPDTNTAATRSIVVGVCLCLLAFAMLVGYSVVASHQIGPRHAGVAANSNLTREMGGTLTVERSRPGAGASPKPGRQNQTDRVLGKRIERREHETKRAKTHRTQPATQGTHRPQRTERSPQHLALETGKDEDSDDTIQRDETVEPDRTESDDDEWSHHHRDHVPQGNAYGYWRNHGRSGGPWAARSAHSRSGPPGHAKGEAHPHANGLDRNDDFDAGSTNSHGNGHAYGPYKDGGGSSPSESHGGWGAGHSNGHAYGHSKH